MDASPSKRRRTSPTTSIPVDAPITPSRIPIRSQPLSARPSFASPTKASLSKHHPQLLRRSSSVGAGAERPRSRGKDIQDVFARALGESRPSMEGEATPVPIIEAATPRGSGHRRARSDGGGLSAKPRRMSRSPFKRSPKTFETVGRSSAEGMQESFNPFVKRGLRRSPPVGSLAAAQNGGGLQDLQEHDINPFEKRGIRRSPVSSQAVEATTDILGQTETLPSPTNLMPSNLMDATEVSRPSVPRGSEPVTTQSTEPITLNSFEQNEDAIMTQRINDELDLHAHEHRVVPSKTGARERHLAASSKRPGRSTQGMEPIAVKQDRQVAPAPPASIPELPRVSERDQSIALPNFHQRRLPEETLTITARASAGAKLINDNRPKPTQHEEPDLPPTPTQLGIPDPIVTTPPTGIHDTPSKRARKKAKLKSSPLKPRDPPPVEESEVTESGPQNQPQKAPTIMRRRSSRHLVPEDPHAARKKIRDELLLQLQELQADVALGHQENERLRLQHESRKKRPVAPTNSDELLDLLLRATATDHVPKFKPKSIFQSINSFLPFTSRRNRVITSGVAAGKSLPSHLPIALDDPLPYLQVFSPLVYTSTISLLPSEITSPETSAQETEPHTLQIHSIKASHPSGLFAARLSMVVDSSLLSIVSLDVEALPTIAEKELGTFMRERFSPDRVLNRDIGVACWAMGSWVEVSVSRAKFWAIVERDLLTPEARSMSLQRKVRKRKRRRSVGSNKDNGTDHEGSGETPAMSKLTMRQLLPHMGRTGMELKTNEVELRVEWRIGFDWTGDAESAISASARLPRTWQKQDERKSLQKVPATFDRLVKEKGPLIAVKAIVGLIMTT